MMFWHDHGVSGWGWFAMSAGTIVFWVLIIAGAVLLFRYLGRSSGGSAPPAGRAPEELLAERYARGEIDEDEYRRRLDTLHTLGPGSKN